jgi:hypothetical protein
MLGGYYNGPWFSGNSHIGLGLWKPICITFHEDHLQMVGNLCKIEELTYLG